MSSVEVQQAYSRLADRYVELFVEPSALTEWTYRKDAVPEGGTTHHIHWVRTPGPVADRIVEWWESRN